jgi:hypothetical protein
MIRVVSTRRGCLGWVPMQPSIPPPPDDEVMGGDVRCGIPRCDARIAELVLEEVSYGIERFRVGFAEAWKLYPVVGAHRAVSHRGKAQELHCPLHGNRGSWKASTLGHRLLASAGQPVRV